MSHRKSLCGAVIALGLSVTAPAQAENVVIGVGPWPSIDATAHILERIIEQNLGVEVELQKGSNSVIFEAMDRGAMHVHPEVWLQNQQNLHDTYVKERGTVEMNVNAVDAFQRICVDKKHATANGIASIFDLTKPEVAALFDTDGNGRGEMYIGVPGWGSTNIERIRAKSYGYDQAMDLYESDETLAYAGLDNAIKAGKPWLGFCYGPHYVFTQHGGNLTVLEEPNFDASKWNVTQPTEDPNWLEKSEASTGWDVVNLHLHFAKVLEQSHPQIVPLLRNFALDTDTVSAFTYALVIEKQDPKAFAEKWVGENEDQVLGWLTN